jgi:hypothetical protein
VNSNTTSTTSNKDGTRNYSFKLDDDVDIGGIETEQGVAIRVLRNENTKATMKTKANSNIPAMKLPLTILQLRDSEI